MSRRPKASPSLKPCVSGDSLDGQLLYWQKGHQHEDCRLTHRTGFAVNLASNPPHNGASPPLEPETSENYSPTLSVSILLPHPLT